MEDTLPIGSSVKITGAHGSLEHAVKEKSLYP